MKIIVKIERYETSLEWALELDGVLWAAGDCVSAEDGQAQAESELAKAGFAVIS